MKLFTFTMLFSGGLVPTYLLYTTYLGVKNTLAGLIVPLLLLNAYWVMIMRTFFQNSIPRAIDLEPQPVFPRFVVFLDESAPFQRIHSTADRTLMKFHHLADTGHTEGPFFF